MHPLPSYEEQPTQDDGLAMNPMQEPAADGYDYFYTQHFVSEDNLYSLPRVGGIEEELEPPAPRPTLAIPSKPALKPRERPETDLPLVLLIPADNDIGNNYSYINYNSITDETIDAIAQAMATILLDTNGTRRKQWATVSRNPVTWSVHPCVSNAVAAKGKTLSTWEKAQDNQTLACDTCIKKRRPCVRIKQLAGEEDHSVVWCALPENLRKGSRPADMTFWMRAK
jgi:predicted lipoprotein with Yx(FWY)xxD motif